MLDPVLSFTVNSKGELCASFDYTFPDGHKESVLISDLPDIWAWKDCVGLINHGMEIVMKYRESLSK